MNGSDNSGFNRERVLRDIKALSIPRRMGTPGDRATDDYLTHAFREAGLPLIREEFSFSAFPSVVGERLLPPAIWLALLAAMKFYPNYPVISILLFAGLLVASVPGTRWSGFVEKLYDLGVLKRSSTNLIAVMKPEKVKGRLVLMAHRDSKSQSLPLYLRLSIHMTFFFSVAGIALLHLSFRIAGADGWIGYLWFPALLLAIPVFLVTFNVNRNDSPGGIDNATGLSILLELARTLNGDKRDGIEVVFLMTGAEEEGLVGAVRFIQGKNDDYNIHDTYFVNLDGIGGKGGLVLSSRHSIPPVRTGGRLETVLLKVAREAGISLRPIYFPISPGLEHLPIAYRGYRAVTLTSSDFSMATLSIHTPMDLPENADPDVIEGCHRLLSKLVRELETGVSG